MDSFVQQHKAILNRLIENEKLSRSIKPYKRPGPKNYLDLFYDMKMINMQKSAKSGQIEFKTTSTNMEKHFCKKDLSQLEKINLNQMYVNQVHHGKYLEAVVAIEPFYITAIQTLIRDENNDYETLSIYNFNKNFDQDPNSLLPKGTKIIIKEPFLKLMASDKTKFFIRVDSPSDIIVFYPENIPKTNLTDKKSQFEFLNKEGNTCFINKKYEEAIRLYSSALFLIEDSKAYSNRSAAHLKLENFYQAFKDAESSVKINDMNEKAYYRSGIALYSMRQYKESLEKFTKCLDLNKNNLEAKKEIEKCEQRLNEETNGIYDFKHLISQIKNGVLRLDLADYESDLIEIALIDNIKCKGVIAKDYIKKNTLLVASKAISISYDCEFTKRYMLLSTNFLNKNLDLNSDCQNLLNLVYKMRTDPYICKKVYSLYAGSEFEQLDESLIDISRVEKICTLNSFKSESSTTHPDNEKNSGLWYKPSFFNHSCVCNTSRLFFGDFMMIYASRDIKKGEEITVTYFPKDNYLEERIERAKIYCFECKCELCELDKSDKNLIQRQNLLKKEEKMIKNDLNFKKCKSLVDKMNILYKNRTKLKIDLIRPLGYLAKSYENSKKYSQAAKLFMEIYEISKELNDSRMAQKFALKASELYFIEGDLVQSKKSLDLANDFNINDDLNEYLML